MDELEIKNKLEEFKNYRALMIVIRPHNVLTPDTKDIVHLPEQQCIKIQHEKKPIFYKDIVTIKPIEYY